MHFEHDFYCNGWLFLKKKFLKSEHDVVWGACTLYTQPTIYMYVNCFAKISTIRTKKNDIVCIQRMNLWHGMDILTKISSAPD